MPPKNRKSLRPPPMRRTATPLPGMNSTRSALPAEIIATILDLLPVRDLLAFARVSHRLQEMVYDDTRWVTKLQLIGVWNETEARKRFDDAMRRKRASEAARRTEEEKAFAATRAAKAAASPTGAAARSSTLFDVAEEENRAAAKKAEKLEIGKKMIQGMDILSLSAPEAVRPSMMDPDSLLTVMSNVRSMRGFARQEFARIYGALAPLYFDLVKATTHTDPEIFSMYRDPEKQAAMLSLLRRFSDCDTALGWSDRTERLKTMIGVFENAALREFEGGYDAVDIEGRMKRYAHVLISLNGGQACVQLFVQKHPVLYEKEDLGNPMDCFDKPDMGGFSLEPSKDFFQKLAGVMNEQASVVDRVFPPTVNVLLPFLDRVAEDVVSEYTTPILDEAHDRDTQQYLTAVTGLFRQSMEFGASLSPTKGSGPNFSEDIQKVLARVFDAHTDLYLQEELDFFRKRSENEVETWDKKIAEQDEATESFFMSNVNREADKRDFLSTFKKVILAPVYVIPSAFITTKPYNNEKETSSPSHLSAISSQDDFIPSSLVRARSSTNLSSLSLPSRSGSPAPPPPTTELAAKAALMNSRLEGMRGLFSLDIALSLVRNAKESLERAATFTRLPGTQTSEEAREQCEAIFVSLLHTLGHLHVKTGFDKAVTHLSHYNPRTASQHTPESGVAPLITFLELVNIGDLIQQMLDVFYTQELVIPKLTDRNDFMAPAAKAKKKFEQMLDERVAAGLNTGIDVLISEVEHLFATTQSPTDFAPPPGAQDLGPSKTATTIINFIISHTSLLVGSTDKNVLEVFNQEVGLRLFTAICKHLKRQRISVDGAVVLISDINAFYEYAVSLKIRDLIPYFAALREVSQLYLIDPKHARQMAMVIADPARFGGVFRTEEVYEFAARREDWYNVKKEVERAMYGFGCTVM